MLVLELGGRRYPVAAGEMIVGSDQDAALPVAGEGVAPRHAVVQGWADGSAAVRAVAGSDVLVNGVRLGPEPTPLLHGDKLHIAGQEILVVDQRRAGQTQLQRAIEIPESFERPATPATLATSATSARIISLTDGRDYELGAGPLVFGRDAGADIVVAGSDVSRRHAELHARPDGFALVDLSVNGTYVNGERVSGERRLARGDVIRLGDEEFRFHAAPAAATEPQPALEPATPPPGAAERLNDTFFGVAAATVAKDAPAPAPVAARSPLASLLVRSGDAKGERLSIRVPIANVGRGEYNDLIIADASVSTMHAKLQSRDGIWVVADLGSTNGTFVDGQLIDGEVPLGPGATIRFGEVATLFEPLDGDDTEPVADTFVMPKLQAPLEPAPAAVAEDAAQPALRRRPRPRTAPPPPNRTPLFVLLALLVVALVLAAFLLLKR